MSYNEWQDSCVAKADKQFSARMSTATWPGFTAQEQAELEDELHQETVGAVQDYTSVMYDQLDW